MIKKKQRRFENKELINTNRAHMKFRNKCDTNNIRGNCKHLKIIQKISEQRSGKARSQGTHTLENANGKVQNIQHGKITSHVP